MNPLLLLNVFYIYFQLHHCMMDLPRCTYLMVSIWLTRFSFSSSPFAIQCFCFLVYIIQQKSCRSVIQIFVQLAPFSLPILCVKYLLLIILCYNNCRIIHDVSRILCSICSLACIICMHNLQCCVIVFLYMCVFLTIFNIT